jgi:hypothetical protein
MNMVSKRDGGSAYIRVLAHKTHIQLIPRQAMGTSQARWNNPDVSSVSSFIYHTSTVKAIDFLQKCITLVSGNG